MALKKVLKVAFWIILVVCIILIREWYITKDYPPNAFFPGRDTFEIWGGCRYELIQPDKEWGFPLSRWQGEDGGNLPVRLSESIERFYITRDYAYLVEDQHQEYDEATQTYGWIKERRYMVIDHTTHEFPVFVSYDELEERHRLVFDDTKRFTYAHPQ